MLTAYEEERNARIASNKELMEKLGLHTDVNALAGAAGECSRAGSRGPVPRSRARQHALSPAAVLGSSSSSTP